MSRKSTLESARRVAARYAAIQPYVQRIQGQNRLLLSNTHVATMTNQGRIYVLRDRGGVKGQWVEVRPNETLHPWLMGAFQGEDIPAWVRDRLLGPTKTASARDWMKQRGAKFVEFGPKPNILIYENPNGTYTVLWSMGYNEEMVDARTLRDAREEAKKLAQKPLV